MAGAVRNTPSVSKAARFAATATAPQLAERCLSALREWSGLQADVGRRATRRANRLADEQRAYLQALAATAEGRRHVESFLDDAEAGVREWAAAHALFWNEPKARRVLERLCSSDTFPYNFNAEMTLREFDAGRLRP
jgi:phage-related protein